MIELVVWDFDQESDLEKMLEDADIEYQLSLDIGQYGLVTPYLVVDGVPLDNKRSKAWVKEHSGK